MEFGTQPCDVCGSTDFIETNTVGNLICQVCGNISAANAIMELDIDESLAMTQNRASIVRISSQVQGAAPLGETRRKYARDTRTSEDLLTALGLIDKFRAESLSAALQDPSILARHASFLTQYLALLQTRQSEMSIICDADNIFLPPAVQPQSLEALGYRLQAIGKSKNLVHSRSRHFIAKLLSSPSDPPAEPQPGHTTSLALLWASTGDFTARQFLNFCISQIPFFSVSAAGLPQELERSDYPTEAPIGSHKSRLRPEKLPSSLELGRALESLKLAGIPVPRRQPIVLLERFLANLKIGPEGFRAAKKILEILNDSSRDKKIFSQSTSAPPGRKRIFREVFIHRHQFDELKIAQRISRLEESFLGDWPLDLTLGAITLVVAQLFPPPPLPIFTSPFLFLGGWRKKRRDEKEEFLKTCRDNIFKHSNESFFRELILEITTPRKHDFLPLQTETVVSVSLLLLPPWKDRELRPVLPNQYGIWLDEVSRDMRGPGLENPQRDLHNATLILRDWLIHQA
jgi:hypothetical protein